MDNITQATESQMTPEDAKASMGISSRLVEQMLQSQAPMEGQETPGMTSEQGENPKVQEAPANDPEALKNEIQEAVKSAVKEEMASLKQELQEALNEEDEQE